MDHRLCRYKTNPSMASARMKRIARYNQFTFDSDPDGVRCPLGAHARRANPRNADFPNPVKGPISHLLHTLGFGRKGLRDDLMSPTRFHRLLRGAGNMAQACHRKTLFNHRAG